MTAFRNLLRAVEEFRKLDPVMPAQMIAHFLIIADRCDAVSDRSFDHLSMKELSNLTGMSQSSTSRIVQYFGKVWKTSKEGSVSGLDLVEAYENPEERRQKLVRLTPKGKRIAQSLREIIGGD